MPKFFPIRVPLPDDTWTAIVNPAGEVGVSEVSIQRAVS
jgi:hydroxycarboxylate dehydrogenase B